MPDGLASCCGGRFVLGDCETMMQNMMDGGMWGGDLHSAPMALDEAPDRGSRKASYGLHSEEGEHQAVPCPFAIEA